VRLAQVFSNLLNNAIKYTPKGGRIRFEVECEQAELVVRVTDTGQGIPPDMVDRVFDLFAQVPGSLERGNSGLGIGLTLVRTLVEMHGGTVSAQSDGPGHGSQFTVRLPLTTADPEETRPAHPESATLAHGAPRILIVDDNRDAALTLSLLLEALGYTVRSAYDGMAGLTAAAAFHPNVVLLDLGLPKLSGYEVAQRLRQESWGQDLRLIAVTGWGQAADRRRTREVGFDYHLVKPITPDILRPLIAQIQRPQT
jgi:CheY-like chemotaxis protein